MNFLKRAQLPGLDTMGLILAVWICTLPLIAFVLVPLVGLQTAIGVAALLLIAMLIICWGRCIPAAIRFYREEKRKRIASSKTFPSPL